MKKHQLRHFCGHAGCMRLIPRTERFCDRHKQIKLQNRKIYDQKRGSATQRGYTSRWAHASKEYLKEHPLCVECQKHGKVTPATEVDHIKPWNDCGQWDRELFWDESNWQALCHECHSRKTVKENHGFGNA